MAKTKSSVHGVQHILNEESLAWIDEFENDVSFIFIEPKIDLVSGNMIGNNFLGRKMEYVNCIDNSNFNDFIINTTGMLRFIENAIKGSVNFELAMQYSGLIANVMYPIFHRVINKKFTKSENEFRIVYQVPTRMMKSGDIITEEQRVFNITINESCNYKGQAEMFLDKNNVKHYDIPLISEDIIAKRQKTSLIDEIISGNTYKLESSFKDVNLQSVVTDYGYIGGKKDCIEFINKKIAEIEP